MSKHHVLASDAVSDPAIPATLDAATRRCLHLRAILGRSGTDKPNHGYQRRTHPPESRGAWPTAVVTFTLVRFHEEEGSIRVLDIPELEETLATFLKLLRAVGWHGFNGDGVHSLNLPPSSMADGNNSTPFR